MTFKTVVCPAATLCFACAVLFFVASNDILLSHCKCKTLVAVLGLTLLCAGLC